MRKYVNLSHNPLSPSPSPNPPHSPLRGGRTKDVSLLLHGRGEFFLHCQKSLNRIMNAIALPKQHITSTKHAVMSLENTAKRSEESL